MLTTDYCYMFVTCHMSLITQPNAMANVNIKKHSRKKQITTNKIQSKSESESVNVNFVKSSFFESETVEQLITQMNRVTNVTCCNVPAWNSSHIVPHLRDHRIKSMIIIKVKMVEWYWLKSCSKFQDSRITLLDLIQLQLQILFYYQGGVKETHTATCTMHVASIATKHPGKNTLDMSQVSVNVVRVRKLQRAKHCNLNSCEHRRWKPDQFLIRPSGISSASIFFIQLLWPTC